MKKLIVETTQLENELYKPLAQEFGLNEEEFIKIANVTGDLYSLISRLTGLDREIVKKRSYYFMYGSKGTLK